MNKKLISLSSFCSAAVLAGALSWGVSLNAQDATPSQPQQPQSQSSQAPDSSGQSMPGNSTPAQSPSQAAPAPSAPAQNTPAPSQSTPDAQSRSQTQSTAGTQTFTGTITKSGDKYVLQDAASGTTYDIDHQDEVAKFEGKKVRVHGTVDASGKMIHVQ